MAVPHLSSIFPQMPKAIADLNIFLVMNPGVIPEEELMSAADLTVVFEERYQTYFDIPTSRLDNLPDRDEVAALMHSVPATLSKQEFKVIVQQLRSLTGAIFVSELSDLYYHSFSPRFLEFVQNME